MSKKKSIKKKQRKDVTQNASKPKNKIVWDKYVFQFLVLIAIIFFVHVASQYVSFGLDRDEGTYINVAESWRSGGDMYGDSYSLKPPGIYFWYALMNTFFGYSGEGLRWSLIFINVLASICLFFIGRKWKGELLGSLMAVSYLFLAFNPFIYGFAALTEHYQNALLVFSAFFLQRGIKNNHWLNYLLAGAILTWGVGIKQNLIFGYLAIAVGLGWHALMESKPRQLKSLLYFIAGSAGMTVILFLPVLFQGNLSDWKYWNLTYSSLYTSAIPWERGRQFLLNFMEFVTGFNAWMWITGIVGWLAGIIMVRSHAGRIALGLSGLAAVLSIFPGLRFYPHYWSYFTPVLSVGCGVSGYLLFELARKYIPRNIARFGIFAIFSLGILSIVISQKQFFENPSELYVNRRLYGDNPFTTSRMLGEYLEQQMGPDDELLVFGSEPQVYTYAERPAPIPYIFFAHLNKTHERRTDMVEDFKAHATSNPPDFIYFSNHPFSWSLGSDNDQRFYQWSHNFAHSGYEVIGIADLIEGQAPVVMTGEQARRYQPQSQKWVKIFKKL